MSMVIARPILIIAAMVYATIQKLVPIARLTAVPAARLAATANARAERIATAAVKTAPVAEGAAVFIRIPL